MSTIIEPFRVTVREIRPIAESFARMDIDELSAWEPLVRYPGNAGGCRALMLRKWEERLAVLCGGE